MIQKEVPTELLIGAVDFSRFDRLKLYGVCILEDMRNVNLKDALEDFPYIGRLRSERKKALVSTFPIKIRKYEENLVLYASPHKRRILKFVERRIRDKRAFLVADPKIYADLKSLLSKNAEVKIIPENKQHLQSDWELLAPNIADAFIRSVKELFIKGRAQRHVKIVRGKKEIW